MHRILRPLDNCGDPDLGSSSSLSVRALPATAYHPTPNTGQDSGARAQSVRANRSKTRTEHCWDSPLTFLRDREDT